MNVNPSRWAEFSGVLSSDHDTGNRICILNSTSFPLKNRVHNFALAGLIALRGLPIYCVTCPFGQMTGSFLVEALINEISVLVSGRLGGQQCVHVCVRGIIKAHYILIIHCHGYGFEQTC